MDPMVATVLTAAEQGHKQRLATVLRENHAMAEACDEEGSTPLMYAAANGRENVLYLLVQNQVDIDARNLYGWTALMQASCYGHLTCAMLLVQYKADVHLCNSWGASALVGAAQGGFDTVVQFLLDKGARVNVADEVTSLTSLMAAAQCGHADIVTKLIKAGSNVNTVLKTTGWSALMLAAINNQKEVVTLLLQHGAKKDRTDISKRTAVQLATVLGHREAALALDDKKTDTVSDADFFEAVKTGQPESVEAMLRDCPALAHAKTKDGVTPLMRAANKGHVKVCEILLSGGCPVNAKDSVNGWTALMQATHQRRYEVAKLLGNHGAAVNLRGKSGSTAFDIANMLGDIEMIRIVANISVERIRKTSAPPSTSSTSRSDVPSLNVSVTTPPNNTSATPPNNNSAATPNTFTPTPESPTTPGAGPHQKKNSVPPGHPRGLKPPTPTSVKQPLDTSELIRKLKMAYADPVSPPAIPSTKATVSSSAQDSPGALPRFPGSRLRSNHKPHPPGSNPSSPSLNSSTDTCYSVSPGTSISSTHLDSSSQSRDCPLTPEPPRSASYLTPDRPPVGLGGRGRGGAARFLSRSNPPPTERVGGKQSGGGGKGGISIPPLRITANRHSLISLEAADTTKTGSRAPLLRGGGGGGREGLPLFLQKFEPSSSRIPPMLSVAGRSKEILPQSSWRVTGGQKNLKTEKLKLQEVPPTRRRSFTVPAKAPPKSRPGLQVALEHSLLGEYYNIFAEQELDLCSFLTLSESDLIDLQITNGNDRQRLLSLIHRLQNRNRTGSSSSGATSSNGATSTPTPVFLFQ